MRRRRWRGSELACEQTAPAQHYRLCGVAEFVRAGVVSQAFARQRYDEAEPARLVQ